MNAPIAPHGATTHSTNITDIVPTAVSATQTRIDLFLKQQLHAARSDAGYGVAESAAQLERLGFTQSANVRYSEFLAAFRNSTDLDTKYKEKYPSSIFVNWKAFHLLLKVMDLCVDLPRHYRGAVPPEQIPWMEIFDFDKGDEPQCLDFLDMLEIDRHTDHAQKISSIFEDEYPVFHSVPHHLRFKAQQFKQEAQNSFFVVAPPEAFETKIDWLGRLRRLVTDIELTINPPPPDPLVVRFCHGGVIVVAAWGDEANVINQAAIDLQL